MKTWSALKPKAAANDVATLDIEIERYLEEKPLAEKTKSNYKYNCARAVIDTLVVDRAAQRLMKLASTEMCSVRSPHRGATSVVLGFKAGWSESTACEAGLGKHLACPDCYRRLVAYGVTFRNGPWSSGKLLVFST